MGALEWLIRNRRTVSTEDKVRKPKWDGSGSTGNHINGHENFFYQVKPLVQHTREEHW